MYFVEEAVPIAEIAKATRMTTSAVEDVCRDVGFVIGEDWVGRPAVTTREAWHIASGQAAERAKLLKEKYPQLNVHIVPGCKHLVSWDAADEFIRLAGPFLKG